VLLLPPEGMTPALPESDRVRSVRLRWPDGAPPPRWRESVGKALLLVPGLPPLRDAFARQIDALGLDLVHYPATRIPQLALDTPAVLTFFDMQDEFFPAFFPWRERLGRAVAYRHSVDKARLVIAPSEFTARCLQSRYGTPASKIACVPVGVGDAFQPEPQPAEEERLRSRYGVKAGEFALYPANPWPHKNHQRLFGALRRLNAQGVRLSLVCTGKLAAETRTARGLAAAAGLEPDQVHDLGFVPEEDMPALYRAARMLVFPSLFEGFGMPVLEAMASGCPVACSRAASLPEIGGDAVWYFDPTSEQGIVEAVAAVLRDDRPRAVIAEPGLERARAFRWDKITPAVVSAYGRMAKAPALDG